MKRSHDHDAGLFAIRPLVRYVDESQAVVEIHVAVHPIEEAPPALPGAPLEVVVRVEGPDGYLYEHQSQLCLQGDSGVVRFELGDPQRWWPSGMGQQALYNLSVLILDNDHVTRAWENTIGLTSVRPAARISYGRDDPADSHATQTTGLMLDQDAVLLINGHQCPIENLVPVYPADERSVLPVGKHCLLVVREHYGPDILYHAADRAGTLLIQSIPTLGQHDPTHPPSDADESGPTRGVVQSQVNRLVGHPSLAGWLVPQADEAGDRLVHQLRRLDPTRSVFRAIPG